MGYVSGKHRFKPLRADGDGFLMPYSHYDISTNELVGGAD